MTKIFNVNNAILAAFALPQGTLINGKISVSVASNNLTVAIKGLDGNDPSATNPVYYPVGGVVRSITAALSVTKNAATNWCNAGSAELATKLINYFVYLGYNATDGVVIGFSRIPYARFYSDFSTTSTNEKYAAISTITTAASSDEYVNIGRFSATLSAGAGYTWSISGTGDVINRPIYETDWLEWTPALSASGSMTYTSTSVAYAKYKTSGKSTQAVCRHSGTTGGSASNTLNATLPIESALASSNPPASGSVNDTSGVGGFCFVAAGTPDTVGIRKVDGANFGLGAGRGGAFDITYEQA